MIDVDLGIVRENFENCDYFIIVNNLLKDCMGIFGLLIILIILFLVLGLKRDFI